MAQEQAKDKKYRILPIGSPMPWQSVEPKEEIPEIILPHPNNLPSGFEVKTKGEVSVRHEERMTIPQTEPKEDTTEPTQVQKSLKEMYELGKEHGRALAERDMEIKRLIKEIKGE